MRHGVIDNSDSDADGSLSSDDGHTCDIETTDEDTADDDSTYDSAEEDSTGDDTMDV